MATRNGEPIPLADDEDSRKDSIEAMFEEMGSRPHHMFFAHHIFRGMVFENPALPFAAVAAGKGDDLVRDVWRKVGEQISDGASGRALPDKGLTVEAVDIVGCPAVLLHLPPPKGPPEAYFVAIVMTQQPRRRWLFRRSPLRIRYITLEYGVSLLVEEETHTVLCEWDEGGTHLNYGRGPSPDRAAFIEAVSTLLSHPEGRSETVVAMSGRGDDPTDGEPRSRI